MTKYEFLFALHEKLKGLPEAEVEDRLRFYVEMIEDRMEEGLSEEEAVAAIGNPDDIARNIIAETPVSQLREQEATPKRKLSWWEITLLVLGFPVWGALVIAVAAVIFSVWVSLCAVVISLYATAFALAASAVGCVFASFFMIGSLGEVMVVWGAALLCAGLAILFFMLSNLAAKGMVTLTKLTWNSIFHRKERTV